MSQRPLRIVFVTNNYTPYSGGVVSSINAFTQELIRQGHVVDIITLDFLGDHHDDPTYVHRIKCPIKFTYKNNCMAIPLYMQSQLQDYVTRLKPDIIHSHHPWLLGSAAADVAHSEKIPLIFTYHTLYEHYAHYIPLPSFFTKPIITWLVHNYCTRVQGIIAPSSAVKAQLDQLHVTIPTTILQSPIAQEFLQQDSFLPTIKDTARPCRLLLVSRLVKEKNIEALLDMLAILEQENPGEFCLTLVGYGAHTNALMQYAFNTLKLSKHSVTFIDKKSKHELLNLYPQFDFFVFSSVSDTQGLVLAEAMSCGLPVVALNGPGQRDILEHGENGFLVPSITHMKQLLHNTWLNQSLYRTMQLAARKTALRYCPITLTESLVRFYRQFV